VCLQLTNSLSNLVTGALSGLSVAEPPRRVLAPQLDLLAFVEYASLLANRTFVARPGSNTSIALPPTGAETFLDVDGAGDASLGVAVTVSPALGGVQSDAQPLSRVTRLTMVSASADQTATDPARRRRVQRLLGLLSLGAYLEASLAVVKKPNTQVRPGGTFPPPSRVRPFDALSRASLSVTRV
jgi:hypothetical protein